MSGPYREEPSGPTHVCLVCYAHASSSPGLCPRCEVDLLPLDRQDVRDELRDEAERRMQKRMYGEYFKLSLLGFTLAWPLIFVVGDIGFVLGALGMGALCVKGWTRFRPSSALALYADRRRRLHLALIGAPPQKALPGATADDPEELGTLETLRWLGIDVSTSRQ